MGANRRYRKKLSRAFFVLPEIPDDAPGLKDALAIRSAADLAGRCRCGAVARLADGTPVDYDALPPGRLTHSYFLHEVGCPALTDDESDYGVVLPDDAASVGESWRCSRGTAGLARPTLASSGFPA